MCFVNLTHVLGAGVGGVLSEYGRGIEALPYTGQGPATQVMVGS